MTARIAQVTALAVLGLSVLALLGWWLDLPLLYGAFRGSPGVQPLSALWLALAGVSLWLQLPISRRSPLARILAMVVTLAGAMMLLEALMTGRIGGLIPGNPAPVTGLLLVLLGQGLWWLDERPRRSLSISDTLALAAVGITLAALLDYLFGVIPLGRPPRVELPLPTALATVAACTGLWLARPDRGLAALVMSRTPGGLLIRRFLPPLLLCPILLGWLRLQGEEAGLYPAATGVLIMVIGLIITTLLVLWHGVSALNAAEQLRQGEARRSEAALRSEKAKVEQEVDRRTAELQAALATLRASQAATRDREARLAEAQHLARLGSWEWDVVHDRVQWSDEQYRLFGFQPQESTIDYETVLSRVHPEDRARHTAVVQQALRDHLPYDFDHRVVHPDGTVLILHSLGSVTLDESGTPVRLLGTSQDATEQRHMEAQRARMLAELARQRDFTQRIIDNSPALIAYLDHELIYRSVNPAMVRLVRLPAEQLLGHSILEVYGPGTREQLAPLFREVLATGKPYAGLSFPFAITRDGHERMTYWDQTFQPVFGTGGEVEGILILATEVSERIANERLQAERIEALERAERMKDEFLSVISHELRTPLNFIMGYSNILLDEMAGPLTARQQDYLTKVLEGTDRMLLIVSNLIDASQVTAGTFRIFPSATSFDSVVRESVGLLEPVASQKQVSVDVAVEVPEEVPLDGQRITQVLTNLLDNAIKFSHAGGKVTIRSCLRDRQLITEVIDRGEGITPEDLPKLFKPFTQLDMSSTRAHGGTGLGLTISKTIVEAHGGEVGVISEPGRGSTFWFTLPLPATEGHLLNVSDQPGRRMTD